MLLDFDRLQDFSPNRFVAGLHVGESLGRHAVAELGQQPVAESMNERLVLLAVFQVP